MNLLLVLMGCAEPFTVARADLGPFRIAALGVQDGAAYASVWSGEGLFHSTRPELVWTQDGVVLGSGQGVPIPGEGTLELTATSADGTVKTATVTIAEAPPAFGLERGSVEIDSVELEDRQELVPGSVAYVAPEGTAVRVTLTDVEVDEPARWMSADGLGTVLQVDDFAADVLAEELEFEDGELASREDLGPGLYHQLVLIRDGAGGNRWMWVDVAIGVEGDFIRQGGRLIEVDTNPGPGWIAATVEAADGLSGVRLVDLETVEDLGQHAVDCGPVPFDFDALADGHCALEDVLGGRVVIDSW